VKVLFDTAFNPFAARPPVDGFSIRTGTGILLLLPPLDLLSQASYGKRRWRA
jgi:hypothetical protein